MQLSRNRKKMELAAIGSLVGTARRCNEMLSCFRRLDFVGGKPWLCQEAESIAIPAPGSNALDSPSSIAEDILRLL